jgi:hypothetical protein
MPIPPNPIRSSDFGAVKIPTRDVTDPTQIYQIIPAEEIQQVFFEQMSALELAQIITHDTIEGGRKDYSIISNLSSISRAKEVDKALASRSRYTSFLAPFQILLYTKIPSDQYLQVNNLLETYEYLDEDGNHVVREKGYIYVDTNGDIIIELENISGNELLQVQIDSGGTIYEVSNV